MTDTMQDVAPSVLEAALGEFVCDDMYHERGQSFHTPGSPGEFVMLNECCGDRTIVCRSRAYYLKYMAAEIHCTSCDTFRSPSSYRFIPVREGVKPV